jgi:hypothetical protein
LGPRHHGNQPPKGLPPPEPPETLQEPPLPEPPPEDDALPETYADLIETFNRRYAGANEAGKATIFELVMDPVRGRQVLTRIGFEDFCKFYMNRILTVVIVDPKGKPKKVTKTHAEWWLGSLRRRQYIRGVVFDPTGFECWTAVVCHL